MVKSTWRNSVINCANLGSSSTMTMRSFSICIPLSLVMARNSRSIVSPTQKRSAFADLLVLINRLHFVDFVLHFALYLLGFTFLLLNMSFGLSAGLVARLLDLTDDLIGLAFDLICCTSHIHCLFVCCIKLDNARQRYVAFYLTSKTGTGTSCTTRVATEPITRLPKVPIPRVPITTTVQLCSLTAAPICPTTSPTASWVS